MPLPVVGLQNLLDLTVELHRCPDESTLFDRLTTQISRVVDADLVSFNRIDLSGTNGGTYTSFDNGLQAGPAITRAFDAFAHQSPLVAEYARTGDGAPRRMSDHVSLPDLRRLDFFEHVFRPLETRHQSAFALTASKDVVVGLGLNRARRDFTDDEMALLKLLHRQLPAVFSHLALKVAAAAPVPADLTPREHQLWALLDHRRSDREIAALLGMNRRTVEKHLQHLYRKLGVPHRTAAAALRRSTRPDED